MKCWKINQYLSRTNNFRPCAMLSLIHSFKERTFAAFLLYARHTTLCSQIWDCPSKHIVLIHCLSPPPCLHWPSPSFKSLFYFYCLWTASEPAPVSGALSLFSRSSHRSWPSWEGPGQGLVWSPGLWKNLGMILGTCCSFCPNTFPFPFHPHPPQVDSSLHYPCCGDLPSPWCLTSHWDNDYHIPFPYTQRPVPWDMNVKWLFLMMPQKASRMHLHSRSSMPSACICKTTDSHLSNSWAMRRGKLSGPRWDWVYGLGLSLHAWRHGAK